MRKREQTLASTVILALVLIAGISVLRAYWIDDGSLVCGATGSQYSPELADDGEGGAIVAWYDYRNGNADIYAQRVDAGGNALWTSNGIEICVYSGTQLEQVIVPDGDGGAIIAWIDNRGGDYDIYAQRVDEDGIPQWLENGINVCNQTGNQNYPVIVSDGSGGAIIAWQDMRTGVYQVFAQRVNAYGHLEWTPSGVDLCMGGYDERDVELVSDGLGGAFATWDDVRSGNSDIYAQRVDADGNLMWSTAGVAVCTEDMRDQLDPQITRNGSGGVVIVWADSRTSYFDIYAQSLSGSGVAQWTIDGIAVCAAVDEQTAPHCVSNTAGDVTIVWEDERHGYDVDIYAQRIDAGGNALWTGTGVEICRAYANQQVTRIARDGENGVYISWVDYRSTNYDIYAQHVDAGGDIQWREGGIVVRAETQHAASLEMIFTERSGAILAWQDSRSGENDIYAQYVPGTGEPGALPPDIYDVRDVPGDEGGSVYLSWYASPADACHDPDFSHYTIWRAIDAEAAMLMVERGALLLESTDLLMERGAAMLASAVERKPERDRPVIRAQLLGGTTYFWQLVDTCDGYHLEAYGMPVATLFDSTTVSTEYHYFQVIAHTTDPLVYWTSEPDSGYSVDNLCPCPPLCLAGEQSFVPEGLILTWARNTEVDLDGYAVYRGPGPGFTPGPGNLLTEPCDTFYFDGDWRWDSGYCYKVAAVDVHGNESEYTLLCSDGVTGDETPPTPRASFLAQNHPNPFNPQTVIAFGLAEPAHVTLRIYDAAGRLVRTLVDETRAANRYEVTWDGRDSAGRPSASGVYFYMLNAGAFERTRKMALIR